MSKLNRILLPFFQSCWVQIGSPRCQWNLQKPFDVSEKHRNCPQAQGTPHPDKAITELMSSVRIEGRGERDKGEEPEDMDEQEDDQVRRIAVDDYLTECGGFGSYQWRLFALTGPVFSFFFNWKLDLETLSLSLSLSLSL